MIFLQRYAIEKIWIFTLVLFFCGFYFNLNAFNFSLFKKKVYKTNQAKCSFFNKDFNSSFIKINGAQYPRVKPLSYDSSINYDCLNKQDTKVILFWTDWLKKRPTYNISQTCPVRNCLVTRDKSMLNKSDVVIFHMRHFENMKTFTELPKRPSYHQRWLFMLYESPLHTRISNTFNGVFNISSTYKSNSNIISFYYKNIIWKENKEYDLNKDRIDGKSQIASIIASNCNTFNKRLSYVNEMRKYMPVKIYGKCGVPCPKLRKNKTCKGYAAESSLFYLAFENAICNDYVTEKFFDILEYDVVPVVLGGGNYETYVPKEAYINVLDFNSPKELSEYLIYLSKNSSAYNSYFKWKRYASIGSHVNVLCEVCIKISMMQDEWSVIKNMNNFWSFKKDCNLNHDFVAKLKHLSTTTKNSLITKAN